MEPLLTWTVAQVNELASVAVEQAFGGPIWVEGEICNLNRSARGHVYFTLIEPGADRRSPDTQLSVTLFEWNKQKVNLQIRRAGGGIRVEDGVKVRIRGNVELYQAKGQLQLRMIAIDPAYTLGDLAAARAALLARLSAEGLLAANGRLAVPMLPLRVGLITSLGSAAHADFLHELELSGINFDVVEVDARVQGIEAEETIADALEQAWSAAVDVVCLVRGGGARTDLAAFDTEQIARAIAAMPMPVWVGIGHEIDRTVADEVAHSSFKTPTACAAALVDAVRDAVVAAESAWADIARLAERRLDIASNQLTERLAWLERGVIHRLDAASRRLDSASATIVSAGPRLIRAADRALDAVAAQIRAFDPARIIERGWSITTRPDGTIVRSVASLSPGDDVVNRLIDGDVRSTVSSVEPNR